MNVTFSKSHTWASLGFGSERVDGNVRGPPDGHILIIAYLDFFRKISFVILFKGTSEKVKKVYLFLTYIFIFVLSSLGLK